MNTISRVSQRPVQNLHPLSLLAQLISRNASGCLQVVSGATVWLIYLDQGGLAYATHSADPFERLDRHLRQLSRQIPALASAVRVQVRLLFETPTDQPLANSDYQAICWLVEQQYLNRSQAATLIEELAKEVIESFLAINQGSYEVIEKRDFEYYPDLCQLELRAIVEHCHNQLRRRQARSGPAEVVTPMRPVMAAPDLAPPSPQAAVAAPTGWPERSSHGNVASAETSTKQRRYTIACIDDSPTILQSINSFLYDSEFSVLMINDPVKALMQVVRSKPDLILLDVEMPNLDGYELCSLLRRHPNFKNTPIVMVTGNTGFVDRAKAKLVRASGYLTKPFTQSDLLKMVFKHLNP
jgi:two-component system, chemotaxis family, response regulator PixG